MRDLHLDSGLRMLGNHQLKESGGELLREGEGLKPGLPFSVWQGAFAFKPRTLLMLANALPLSYCPSIFLTFYFGTKLTRLALNSLCMYPRQVLALSSSCRT